VTQAILHSQKADELHSNDKDAVGVQLLQIARDFEGAGDLSITQKCACYDRAEKLLKERMPMLQGDHFTLDGKAYSLAPLRQENEEPLAEVQTKRATT